MIPRGGISAPAQMRIIVAKTKFRPLHDRVVVKRVEAEEKSKGGISFRTPPKRSRNRAKSSPWGPAAAMKTANSF